MLKKLIKNVRHMLLTGTPWFIYPCLLLTMSRQGRLRREREQEIYDFQAMLRRKSFTFNWSGPYVHNWMHAFRMCDAYGRKTRALEIGSWEGMASLFIVHHLPLCELTCVDTWAGAQEHQGLKELKTIEERFDANLDEYKSRLTKFKGTSHEFLSSQSASERFDIIFVDGSHRCDDVLVDAIKSFELLKVGGVMIFDDYFWKYYRKPKDNPAAAINSFLRLKRGSYELIAVYWQLIIRKTKDDDYKQA